MYQNNLDMSLIDLKHIIAHNNLSKKELAVQLFPENKYPDLALNRVISGESVLDINQASKLASILDVTVSELLNNEKWTLKSKKDLLILKFEDYKAVLNLQNWTAKVFHNQSLFHEKVIVSRTIPLNKFLNNLNSIIKEHQNGKSN